jgi:phage shock protein C
MKMPNLKGRKLYRSPREAVVLGVCSGVAQYLEVDPVFVRLLTIALSFVFQFWPVAIVYLLAYFLMPIDPAQDTVAKKQEPKDVTPEKMDSAQNV